jgi:FMN phosphatase YigB (HAD superfamily)
MKNRLILLDIDNTLYDSAKFREKLFERIILILKRRAVEDAEGVCERIYADLIHEKGLFYPEDFIQALQKALPNKNIPEKELLASMYDDTFAAFYLYEETHTIVKEFKKLGELGIFSQGMKRFQRLKIKQIAHIFKDHHIHIVPNKISAFQTIFKKYQQHAIFFLDDSLPILHAVKTAYPSTVVIWVKRGRYAQNQKPIGDFVPDATVQNLQEAERIIKKT